MTNQNNNNIINSIKSAALYLAGLTSASDADDSKRWLALNAVCLAAFGKELGQQHSTVDWDSVCEDAHQLAVSAIGVRSKSSEWAAELVQDRTADLIEKAGYYRQ